MNAESIISPLQKTGVYPRGQTVLVVDDSQDMLLVQKTILQMEGYTVVTAQSGDEALTKLSTMSEPDLILLDIQMRDMDGYEFLDYVAKHLPDLLDKTPIVFVTGAENIPKGLACGVIKKPPELNSFTSAVRRFISQRNKH